VLQIAQDLAYTPSKHLPLFYTALTHLGLLVRPMPNDFSANPFYADVYHGVEQICRELRINLSFSVLDIVGNRLRSLPALVDDERIGGLVLIGAIPPELVEAVVTKFHSLKSHEGKPVVLVDNWYSGCQWDSVMIDNLAGARIAAELLIGRGHRHIVFISGPDHPSIVERRLAYESTMQQHGLTPAVVQTENLEPSDGEAATEQVLRLWPETTSILCSNDNQAIGVLERLQALERRVPEDLSVVGFDDISLAQHASPPITTIHVDRTALGRNAVELLLGRLGCPDRPPIRSVVGVTLVERASVCQPRAHRRSPVTLGLNSHQTERTQVS
jgi:LacI family transcriptional regulator